MARQNINNTPANSGLGDTLFEAMNKINAMTLELYATDSSFADEIDLINVTIAKVNDGSLLNHTHTIAQIQGLQSTLNSKVSSSTYIGDMMAINASIQAINNSLSDIIVILTGTTTEDIFVTGGTHSNGTTIFTNNSGGTFNVSGYNKGTVTSVGLNMPSAFNISNSPIVSAGTINVTAAGSADQYVRGDGTLANFPSNVGGGSSISYFLNGSINQGTISGNTFHQLSRIPVIGGTGTTFTRNTDGYIAQFISDVNDPSLLSIPAGNWDLQLYFSSSSAGGNPQFYGELFKYSTGGTLTLISNGSLSPESITNGNIIDVYTSTLAVPLTSLSIGDRLVIKIYTITDGRTITLYTEDNKLAEIHTTFSTGLAALNGLTEQIQYFQSNSNILSIVSSGDTHNFNINLPIDVNVTGGTYSNGTAIFTNNTGGTFNISGFYTGATDVFTTGGTYSNGTAIFSNNTGGTFTVTGLTTPFTGGSVNGATQFTNGLTANTLSATTYQNLPVVSSGTSGILSSSDYNNFSINQIKITTSISITTNTTGVGGGISGLTQHGRNVKIDNGANAINITVETSSNGEFVASYTKLGTSAITFLAGSGATLVQVDGTAILSGIVGSTACLTREGNTYYLQISNR